LLGAHEQQDGDDHRQRRTGSPDSDGVDFDELLADDVRDFPVRGIGVQVLEGQRVPNRVHHRVDDDLSMKTEKPEQLDEEDGDQCRDETVP